MCRRPSGPRRRRDRRRRAAPTRRTGRPRSRRRGRSRWQLDVSERGDRAGDAHGDALLRQCRAQLTSVVGLRERLEPCTAGPGLGHHRRADRRRMRRVVAQRDQSQVVRRVRHDRAQRRVAPVPETRIVEDRNGEVWRGPRPGRRPLGRTVDPSGDVARRAPDGGSSVEPEMWQPLRPVPLRDTVGVSQDDDVDVGGAVEGDRLDQRSCERAPSGSSPIRRARPRARRSDRR